MQEQHGNGAEKIIAAESQNQTKTKKAVKNNNSANGNTAKKSNTSSKEKLRTDSEKAKASSKQTNKTKSETKSAANKSGSTASKTTSKKTSGAKTAQKKAVGAKSKEKAASEKTNTTSAKKKAAPKSANTANAKADNAENALKEEMPVFPNVDTETASLPPFTEETAQNENGTIGADTQIIAETVDKTDTDDESKLIDTVDFSQKTSKPADKVEEAISEKQADDSSEKNENTDSEQNTKIEHEEAKTVGIYPESQDPDAQEHFIIPEKATFTVTEPEKVEIGLFPEGAEVTESENELLDIEHFSDYKQKTETVEEVPIDAEQTDNELPDVTYETLTILSDEDETVMPPEPVKQKYEDPDRERYDPEKPRKVDFAFDFLELFIFTLLAVILLITFVFRTSRVEGNSMQNTLQDGERLIVSNLFYTPKKGDIVVCMDKAAHNGIIVKRVIATEGDTIKIERNPGVSVDSKERFTVYVNGEPIEEDYVFVDGIDLLPNGGPEYPGLEETTVPEGMIFVMGDHRNNSTDSRDVGFIREDAVLGKAVLRYYPFDKFGTLY